MARPERPVDGHTLTLPLSLSLFKANATPDGDKERSRSVVRVIVWYLASSPFHEASLTAFLPVMPAPAVSVLPPGPASP